MVVISLHLFTLKAWMLIRPLFLTILSRKTFRCSNFNNYNIFLYTNTNGLSYAVPSVEYTCINGKGRQ